METLLVNNITSEALLSKTDMLQIRNLSADMLAVLQNGAKASLKISLSDAGVLAGLEIDNQVFDVELAGQLPKIPSNQVIEIPVKIVSGGRLQILSGTPASSEPNSTSLPQDMAVKTGNSEAINIEINPNRQLSRVTMEPIKLDELIGNKLNELQTPVHIQKQVLSNLPRLQISLSSIGEEQNTAENILRPVYDTLKQISQASTDSELVPLQNRLQQNISELVGSNLSGTVSRQISQTTFVKTPLGESFFNAPLKIQPQDTITLTVTDIITPQKNHPEQLLGKFLDLFVKDDQKISFDLQRDSQILSAIIKDNNSLIRQTDSPLLNILADKLPAYNRNILPNVVNFYQAALHKDASVWLGKDNMETITSLSNHNITDELNNFVASAVKDTPLWRIVEIPVYADNNFTPLKLALKKEQDNDSNEQDKNKPGTRFVVETQFSQLGGFQFDGFVRAGERNLDLIIRTDRAQKEDFCSQIINLFKNSLYNLDYKGNIRINQKDNFINFYETTPKGQGIYI